MDQKQARLSLFVALATIQMKVSNRFEIQHGSNLSFQSLLYHPFNWPIYRLQKSSQYGYTGAVKSHALKPSLSEIGLQLQFFKEAAQNVEVAGTELNFS
jgi:hypothetical protein